MSLKDSDLKNSPQIFIRDFSRLHSVLSKVKKETKVSEFW